MCDAIDSGAFVLPPLVADYKQLPLCKGDPLGVFACCGELVVHACEGCGFCCGISFVEKVVEQGCLPVVGVQEQRYPVSPVVAFVSGAPGTLASLYSGSERYELFHVLLTLTSQLLLHGFPCCASGCPRWRLVRLSAEVA